uniref:Uncharacterized protein n=1 Tax=Solanum lycopersicum TaxID=4081 RepID=A0A3Q7ET11_SOLLC
MRRSLHCDLWPQGDPHKKKASHRSGVPQPAQRYRFKKIVTTAYILCAFLSQNPELGREWHAIPPLTSERTPLPQPGIGLFLFDVTGPVAR